MGKDGEKKGEIGEGFAQHAPDALLTTNSRGHTEAWEWMKMGANR